MSLLILDSFGPDLLAKATGMCMVADGIGGLIGPPLLGGYSVLTSILYMCKPLKHWTICV